MELRHLRYFNVVAEELHFGRAATRLHMEPQPLNFQIKQLEREVGFSLFSRRENRMYLTAAGQAFLADVEEILAAAERAVEHGAMVARGESGLLRVGYASPAVNAFLAPAIKHFRTTYPDVAFDTQMLRPAELERALNHQELELGISLLPVPDENFDARPIARTRVVVAVPSSDSLALRERVAWTDLDGRNAISLEHRYPGYQRRTNEMLAKRGISTPIVQHADEVDAALAFVGVGLGIAFLPSIARVPRGDVAYVELPDDSCEAELAAIWRRDDDHPLRARFIETLAAVSADLAPSLGSGAKVMAVNAIGDRP